MTQSKKEPVQPREDWQTRHSGSLEAEYAIYKASAESLGWTVKSFDEWLES